MESGEFKIRIASIIDIQALEDIGRITFHESFRDITPDPDMMEYLDSSFNLKQLTRELKDPNSCFYIIELKNDVIGYGKINFLKPPYGFPEMTDCMEIQRIYVLNGFQREGAGAKLMKVFLDEAKQKQLFNIWLSTGSFNNKAMNFYQKYGFEIIGDHEFMVGSSTFDDVILLKELKAED